MAPKSKSSVRHLLPRQTTTRKQRFTRIVKGPRIAGAFFIWKHVDDDVERLERLVRRVLLIYLTQIKEQGPNST